MVLGKHVKHNQEELIWIDPKTNDRLKFKNDFIFSGKGGVNIVKYCSSLKTKTTLRGSIALCSFIFGCYRKKCARM